MTYRNDDVDHDTKGTLQVIGFLVTQEVANNNDSKDEDDDVENFEIQILRFISFVGLFSVGLAGNSPCAYVDPTRQGRPGER